jgi:hypothetical protein
MFAMESLAETQLSNLLANVSADAESVAAMVLDEIERSLPEIISVLQIPSPIGRPEAQRLEFSVMARPGFRRLNAIQVKQATERLQHAAFLKSLRKAKEILSDGVNGSTSHRFIFQERQPESTTLTTESLIKSLASTEVRAVPILELAAKELGNPLALQPESRPVQEETPLHLPHGMLAETVSVRTQHEDVILEIPDIPIELQEPVAGRNIRGLVALMRGGRLVSFFEPSVSNMIPRGIEKAEVPNKKVYNLLRLEDLIAEYHSLAVSDALEQAPNIVAELRLLDALIISLENEAQWSRISARRFHLINKKHSIGLEPEDVDEFDMLQRLAQKRMHAVQKLPFGELAMLESYMRRMGFDKDT